MLCSGHILDLSLKTAAACRPGTVVAPRHYCPASTRPAAMATRWTPGCSASRPASLAFPCIALFVECNLFSDHARTSTTTARQRHRARPAGRLRDRQVDRWPSVQQQGHARSKQCNLPCNKPGLDWTTNKQTQACSAAGQSTSEQPPPVRKARAETTGRHIASASGRPQVLVPIHPQIHSPWLSALCCALCQGRAHHHGVRTISVKKQSNHRDSPPKMHSRCIPVQSKHGPDLSSSG